MSMSTELKCSYVMNVLKAKILKQRIKILGTPDELDKSIESLIFVSDAGSKQPKW